LITLDHVKDARFFFEEAKGHVVNDSRFTRLEKRLTFALVSETANKPTNQISPKQLNKKKINQAIEIAKKKFQKGYHEETKQIYQQILEKYPKNKKALIGLKNVLEYKVSKPNKLREPPEDELQPLNELFFKGQRQTVLLEAQCLLLKYPNSVALHMILGAANVGLAQLDDAIEAYAKALSIEPNYAEAYNDMGTALQKQCKFERAIDAYTKAISIKPNFADPHYNIGVVLQSQSKLDEAVMAYKNAIHIKPDFVDARYNMANALMDNNKLNEAIRIYREVISIKPDYAEAYHNVGFIFRKQGKLDEAIDCFKQAIAIKEDFYMAYNSMGLILKNQKKIDEAIKAFDKALEINPDYTDAASNKGYCMQLIGSFEEGKSIIQKADGVISL
jgi:tetratricopeptide (TPR) repeat protein